MLNVTMNFFVLIFFSNFLGVRMDQSLESDKKKTTSEI